MKKRLSSLNSDQKLAILRGLSVMQQLIAVTMNNIQYFNQMVDSYIVAGNSGGNILESNLKVVMDAFGSSLQSASDLVPLILAGNIDGINGTVRIALDALKESVDKLKEDKPSEFTDEF